MNKHLTSLELDVVDIHKLMNDIISQPDLFNIKNVKESYWESCEGSCMDEIDAYVWWDKTHLTGGVHRLIANSILMAGSLGPESYLDDSLNVNQLLQQPNSTYKSPIYKAEKNTAEIDKVIKTMKDNKSIEQQTSFTEDPSMKPYYSIYVGISVTLLISIGFIMFNKKRRSHVITALLSLFNHPIERGGRFMPLRNMDDPEGQS
ncbi:uncharacterized protein BX663DRAFT_96136 [Cokeromyces recurvatus]|uniref:uncharacterized protein n=1 Tax=Cokeromyces recurvatus TaxID=90255 RepID=UPI00221F3172|nr:uncharacterized protein BX663DRAFT_96136 [Cokeromyces recurvatus]KAI7901995.1 hypothetical protein BX663DRAFT_96136 [Cokeromyces recurvatus]